MKRNKQRSLIQDIKYNQYLGKVKGCVFCDLKDQQILFEYKYWTLIRNKFPWKNWSQHNVLVLNRHLKNIDLDQLTKFEEDELLNIRLKHKDFMFAHTAWTTQVVKHLHFHLLK